MDIWCQRKGNREGGSEIAGAQALYDDGGFARKSQCSATPFGSHPLLAVPSLYRPLSFLATASSILYSRQIPKQISIPRLSSFIQPPVISSEKAEL